ncbi:hypothetical protein HYV84_04510 [Candidatus Woesearchaeota archaeon]|nr:hypothetical protein [Candidatus Woesearchaeota archaeon]
MTQITVNGRAIEYDGAAQYLTIRPVGCGHGGFVYGVSSFIPGIRYRPQRLQGPALEALTEDLKDEIRKIGQFLRTGVFSGPISVQNLEEKDRPAFERSVALFNEMLKALNEK